MKIKSKPRQNKDYSKKKKFRSEDKNVPIIYSFFILYRKDKSPVYERYTKAFIQKDKYRHSAVTQFR